MNTKLALTTATALLSLSILNSQLSPAFAQGTAFTYQGRLNDGGAPANGTYDLVFTIYDLPTGPGAFANQTNAAVAISNGLFTTMLDFGVTPFTGADRWLEIAVRTNGGGAFTTLNPRQKLTPAPYAITAGNLAAVIANNYSFGSNATVSGGWQNNAGNTSATVGGGQYNIVFGFGGTVGGGHVNFADNNFSTVSGGANNRASGDVSAVGGGGQNTASSEYATVSGGGSNQATNRYATVPGGGNNLAGGQYSFAAGRQAQALHQGAFVWADSQNSAFASTANDQVLIRANGGVGIGLNQPLHTLHVGTTLGTNTINNSPTKIVVENSGAGQRATFLALAGPGGAASPNRVEVQLEADVNQNRGILGTTSNHELQMRVNNNEVMKLWTNGNVGIGINNPATRLHVNGDATMVGNVNFGTQTRQMLNLYGAQHGIGVQAFTTYFRTDNAAAINGFSWFSGGMHSDNLNDPGTGGTELMRLTLGSGLTLNGALNLPATATIYSGGNPFLHSAGFLNFFAGSTAGNLAVSGSQNTGVGYGALNNNSSGGANTAHGFRALFLNTIGNDNSAFGNSALYSNTNGSYNTADGERALYSNTSGNFNTAVGRSALEGSTSGSQNIAIGYQAGINITTGSGNIDIGNPGLASDASTIRIGTTNNQVLTYIAGIYNSPPIGGGTAVYIDSSSRVGITPSSQRFKQNIHAMGDASDVLLALQPVTFQYKSEFDPQGHPQFGLIAEQVEKVDPDLVVHDQEHGIYTVRYEAVNAMLLNEFLKEHHKVELQTMEVEKQKAEISHLKERLDVLETIIRNLKPN